MTVFILMLALQAPVACEFDNLLCRIGEHEAEIRALQAELKERVTRQEFMASRTVVYRADEEDRQTAQRADARDWLITIAGLLAAGLGPEGFRRWKARSAE
jgi:hypothetical protein